MTHLDRKEPDGSIDSKCGAEHGVIALVIGALRRINHAAFDTRERHAEREIARDLTRSDGRLTDDIERRMMRHLSSSYFNPRD